MFFSIENKASWDTVGRGLTQSEARGMAQDFGDICPTLEACCLSKLVGSLSLPIRMLTSYSGIRMEEGQFYLGGVPI